MTDEGRNPMAGRPYGGRNEKPDGAGLPGERPLPEDERTVAAPDTSGREEDESASRAPRGGATMTSKDTDKVEPAAGIETPVEAPPPADATEGDPLGGSTSNQAGRTPDR